MNYLRSTNKVDVGIVRFACLILFIVQFLACTGSNERALIEAIRNRNLYDVDSLVKDGVDLNKSVEGKYPLYLSCELRELSILNLLLEKGANPDICIDSICNTPLMRASMMGDVEICTILLKYGANVDARNSEGVTPLMLAAMNGQRFVLSVLIEKGASANISDEYGNVALHYAVWQDTDVVGILLRAGSKVNVQNRKGVTPLYKACERPEGGDTQLSIVGLLVDSGAVYGKEKIGEFDIFDAARLNGNERIADFLSQEQSKRGK